MPVVDVQGHKLNYLEEGDGPAILFVSGMTMNLIPWTIYQKDFFVDAGYKVIVFDNRDTGSSEMSRSGAYSVSDLAQDAVGLLDSLEIESAHVVGYSLGGMIALDMAVNFPNRLDSLIVLGSTARQLESEKNLVTVVKSAKKNLSNEEFWRFMANKVMSWRFFENPESVERWFGFVTSDLNAQSVDALCRQADSCINFDIEEQLGSIQLPTQVIVGAEDTMLPPHHSELIAKGISHAKFCVIPNAAHAAYSECAPEFNSTVLEFISSIS